MSVLTVQERHGDYGTCRKCGEPCAFGVVYREERTALAEHLTQLCRSCCQEFATYFLYDLIDTSALTERCKTCGQTIPEPEKAKRNTVSSCQRCGTGYEVLVTGSIVYCGKCEEGTEYD